MDLASVTSTPATGAVAMWDLIDLLVNTCGWDKASDSDGTTYSSAGTQVTSGSSGAGGLGNANAWVRLVSPLGGRSLTVQRGASNLLWRVNYSAQAGFSTGSPGATRTPSASDSQLVKGGGTEASPTFSGLFTTDGSYAWRVSATLARYGSGLGGDFAFWAVASLTAGGETRTAFCFEPFQEDSFIECDSMASPTTGDADPILIQAALPSADPSAWQLNTQTAGGWANATLANNEVFAWHKRGLAGASFVKWTAGAWYGNISNLDRMPGNIEVDPYDGRYGIADIPVFRTNLSGGATAGTRVCKGLLAYRKVFLTSGPAAMTAYNHTDAMALLKTSSLTTNVASVMLPWPGGVSPANVGDPARYLGRSPADQDIPSINSFTPVAATLLTAAQPVTVSVYYGRVNVDLSVDIGTTELLIYSHGVTKDGWTVTPTVVNDKETTYQITPAVAWPAAAFDLKVLAENRYDSATATAAYTAPGTANYVNRVRDSVAAAFVFWDTAAPDPSGAFYPGPGTFGVHTSDFTTFANRTGDAT